LQVGEQAAPAVRQFRACLGEFNACPRPAKELHAKFSFEPRDGLGQARWLMNRRAAARPKCSSSPTTAK
jgi:hypothetical protein